MSLQTLKFLKAPEWDGNGTTFPKFADDFMTFTVQAGTAHVLYPHIPGVYAPTGDTSDEKILAHKLQVFVALKSAVDETTWVAVCPDDDLAADSEQRIGFDPNKLYDAFKKHAAGSASHTSGPKLLMDYHSWVWPSQGTYTAQVVTVISELRNLRNRSIILKSDDYALSQPMLLASLRTQLPTALKSNEPRYRQYTTFQEIFNELRHDAELLDALPCPRDTLILTAHAAVDGENNTRQHRTPTQPCTVCGNTTHWLRDCPSITDTDAHELSALDLVTKYATAPDNGIVNCRLGQDGRYYPAL